MHAHITKLHSHITKMHAWWRKGSIEYLLNIIWPTNLQSNDKDLLRCYIIPFITSWYNKVTLTIIRKGKYSECDCSPQGDTKCQCHFSPGMGLQLWYSGSSCGQNDWFARCLYHPPLLWSEHKAKQGRKSSNHARPAYTLVTHDIKRYLKVSKEQIEI